MSYETVYLDTIDGFEFEILCEKIYERLDLGKIEQTAFVKDGGRDIIIHLPEGGSIVIECKHQPNTSIGRPIIQKLHSAVISSGAVKGIVITTGKFSSDAIEHAKKLSAKTPIELIDLNGLTDLAERANIKILFSTSSSPIFSFPSSDIPNLGQKLSSIFNQFQSYPQSASSIIQLIPKNLKIEAHYLVIFDIDQDFTTSAGRIRSLHEHKLTFIINAENGSFMDSTSVLFLKNSTLAEANHIPKLACPTTRTDFKLDQTTLTKLVKKNIINMYTNTVSYIGRNNVNYQKVCQPGERSITITDKKQVLLPRYDLLMKSLEHEYNCSLIQNDNRVSITKTNLFTCGICNKSLEKKILLCNACGNISHGPKFFRSHSFTCKNCQKTICRDCAFWIRRILFFKRILCQDCANKQKKFKKLVKRS